MSVADKLTTVAENVPKVYEAGKQAEYDAFWDVYQQNGQRTNYNNAFSGNGWSADTVKPKYDIIPTSAYMMFFNLKSDAKIDLVEIENKYGIKFDFSKCTEFQYAFYTQGLVRLGVVDTRATSYFSQFCANAQQLHTIEKLILREDGSQTISNASWFMGSWVENIAIEGKIGDTLNLANNTHFTKQSIINIVNALSDTATGKTLTFNKTWLIEQRFGNIDTSEEWRALVASKPNWTISLV